MGFRIQYQSQSLELTISVDLHADMITGREFTQHTGQVGCRGNRIAADLRDDILGQDTAFFRCAAGDCALNIRTGRYTIILSHCIHIQHINTQVSAGHVAKVPQIFDHTGHIIHRNCETNAFDGSAAGAFAGEFCGGDAHNLALHIKQRATGVTGVNGNIGLDHIHGSTLGIYHTVNTADVTNSQRRSKGAQHIADSSHLVTYSQVSTAANGNKRQVLPFHLQQCQVIAGLISHDLGRIVLPAMGSNGHLGAIFDHVVIGNHIAICRNDEAAAAGNAGNILGIDFGRNGNHRIHIARINLTGSQILTGRQRSAGNRTALLHGLFLDDCDLIIHLLGQIFHFPLPILVHKKCRRTTATDNQRKNQHNADKPTKTFPLFAFFRLRRGILRFLLLGLRIIIIIIKVIHKASPYCFFFSIESICNKIMTEKTIIDVFSFLMIS